MNPRNIYIIAKNTFRESIRDRIMTGVLFLVFLFLLFTVFLGSISLGENTHIIKSVGLGGIYFFGMLLTIFLASSLLGKEIDKKTLYFVLPRPVSHGEIVLGKFAGLFGSIAMAMLIMGVKLLLVIIITTGEWMGGAILAIFLELAEIAIFIALALFFATLARPALGVILSVVLLFAGHATSLLASFAEKSGGVIQFIMNTIYYLLPNLEKFNIRDVVLYGLPVSQGEILLSALYAVLYISLLLLGSAYFLKKIEL